MIGYLVGTARSGGIVLDGSGVGWKVHTPTPLTAGESVELHVTTIVREDAILLYGFADGDSQALFAALCKVAGVGPSVAMSLLAGMGAADLVQAVGDKDAKALSKVKGVGVKLAEKIVTLVNLPSGMALEGSTPAGRAAMDEDDVVLALTGLGWPLESARTAVEKARAEHDDEAAVLRAALRS